ncbi:hypothetical protein [Aureibacillus halotolerans]|uniref:ABC-2 family transporter n=1 Tax=Aureibacillus halotolerans TaxID=1508390 RepID=A0A4R6U1Y1_9BACI|nr:hypothetical protein [Aureibacillus halotolerans]TDQ38365.1 hypothetical protein EV213_110112 [Aureibacillus halotolerans]
MRFSRHCFRSYNVWMWFFVAVVLLLCAWDQRMFVMDLAQYKGLHSNQWDVLMACLGSPFLVLYLISPFWIFHSSRMILQDWDPVVLIRFKSPMHWVWFTLAKRIGQLIVFYVLLLLAAVAMTTGIPWESDWSAFTKSPSGHLIAYTQPVYESGISPWLGVLLEMGLAGGYLIVIQLLLYSLFLLFSHKRLVLLFGSVLIFIGGIVSYKMVPGDLPFAKVTSYFVLSYTLQSFPAVWVPFAMYLLFSVVLLGFAYLYLRMKRIE